MDQNLDLQIAALIFLGGTQNLVSGSDHGGVETMSDDEEVEAEPRNTASLNITDFPLRETILPTVHKMMY
ncbi:MAG: hypothetical protein CMA71_01545 [Euryarchaeota archaeon]|jgi:hypothetical protein|nr:hypothetical protein [Euryarchaeota archaeon]|tara:strand:+ start:174 stop:383 length:210 start_codon:yes stop_codon:yes gene_type:complete